MFSALRSGRSTRRHHDAPHTRCISSSADFGSTRHRSRCRRPRSRPTRIHFVTTPGDTPRRLPAAAVVNQSEGPSRHSTDAGGRRLDHRPPGQLAAVDCDSRSPPKVLRHPPLFGATGETPLDVAGSGVQSARVRRGERIIQPRVGVGSRGVGCDLTARRPRAARQPCNSLRGPARAASHSCGVRESGQSGPARRIRCHSALGRLSCECPGGPRG